MRIDRCSRSGCAETLDSQDYSIVSYPAIPRHGMCCFHRDALDALGQYAVAVGLILPSKNLHAGNAHGARANSVGLELLLRIEHEGNLRSARHQHDFRRATRSVRKHVGTASEA